MDSIFDSAKMETIFDNAKIFNQINTNLKEKFKKNNEFFISFTNTGKMNIKIKVHNKNYDLIIVTIFRINSNKSIDLEVELTYSSTNSQDFVKRQKVNYNGINFDNQIDIDSESEYSDYSSNVILANTYNTELTNISVDNINNVVDDIIKASEKNNFLLDMIK